MAYIKCCCQCNESLNVPEDFFEGIMRLQKLYEKDFITMYSFAKVGHLDKKVEIKEFPTDVKRN